MRQSKFTFFEKILLFIGVLIVLMGYFMIQKMVSATGGILTWESIMSVFLWILVSLSLITLAANENVKEELKWIQHNQVNELKLIKQELRYMQESSRLKKK